MTEGFTKIQKVITPDELKELLPLSDELKEIKKQIDKEIIDVFEKKSDKFLVIIGPCSADNEKSVGEYVERLSREQKKYKDKLILIPRIYTNKPRTTGMGYKGALYQPNPNEEPNFLEGLKLMRTMHINVLKNNLVSADEMLYPQNYSYLSDVLGYVAVGARSVENQQHRLTSSAVKVPVGMKNPTGGDLEVMFNAVIAAQNKHTFLYREFEVKSRGNSHAHCILRGYQTKNGNNIPNYHYEDLVRTQKRLMEIGIKNPSMIIDTNHANSAKQFKEQQRIAMEILYNRKQNKDLKKIIVGLLIESYLVEGTQKIEECVYGKSITDPCIGWEDTEKLLKAIYDNV